MVSTTAAVKSGALRMSRKEYATSWVIDIETSMRRTAGREFSKTIGACNGYGDNERRDLFPQGVASPDPHPDSVILWTRRPPVGESRAALLAVEVPWVLGQNPDCPSWRRPVSLPCT
jgi:phosphodiesterase/alkaline phosphatase D-like protein